MSAHDSTAKLHATVEAILADISRADGIAGLRDSDLRRWVSKLDKHPQRHLIGKQLIALARTFDAKKAGHVASQLVVLATYAIGPKSTATTLASEGFKSQTRHELIEASETIVERLELMDDDELTVVDEAPWHKSKS